MTVLGWTRHSRFIHPSQACESQAKRARSMGVGRGRLEPRLRTSSWCHRARFSSDVELNITQAPAWNGMGLQLRQWGTERRDFRWRLDATGTFIGRRAVEVGSGGCEAGPKRWAQASRGSRSRWTENARRSPGAVPKEPTGSPGAGRSQGGRRFRSGVRKLCSSRRIFARAWSRAAGSSSSTSRVKVTSGNWT